MKKVLIIGNVNPDIVLIDVNEYPQMGQELWINDCKVVMGGGAGNCSIDLSKLGCSTYLLSKVGTDFFGKFLLEGFNKYNVNTQFVQVNEKIMTGMSIAITKKKERSFISFKDKQSHINFNNMSDNDLQRFSHVHLMGYNKKNSNSYIEFCKRVKALNISISADVGWDSTEKWDSSILNFLKEVDIFIPNEVEAKNYSGKENKIDALDFLSNYVDTIVIKLGGNGCIAKSKGKFFKKSSFNVQTIDTIGAGDAFDSGFIYAYINGMDIEKCLDYANTCGAISTTLYGATDAFPTLEQLENQLP